MISPGWEAVMAVWTSDVNAGQHLRCLAGVSSLLQCLERTRQDGDAKGNFIKLQNSIVWRFVLALHSDFGDEVQPALVQAIHWTTLRSDVWTKQEPRRRLCKVLKRLAWRRWQVKLPALLAETLAAQPARNDPTAPHLLLPLPSPPGLARQRRPLVPGGVRLLPAQLQVEEFDLSDPDERCVALLESALQPTSSSIEAPWLPELRRQVRQDPEEEPPAADYSALSRDAAEFVPQARGLYAEEEDDPWFFETPPWRPPCCVLQQPWDDYWTTLDFPHFLGE